MTNSEFRAGRRPPVTLSIALLLVVVEAGALLALSGALAVEAVRDWSAFPASALGMIVAFAGFAVLLLVSAWAVLRRRRWGRSPLITWQVLVAAIAGSQADLLGWAWSVLVVVVAVAVGAALLSPGARRWTDGFHGTDPARGSAPDDPSR